MSSLLSTVSTFKNHPLVQADATTITLSVLAAVFLTLFVGVFLIGTSFTGLIANAYLIVWFLVSINAIDRAWEE